jgi:hypothetical protein
MVVLLVLLNKEDTKPITRNTRKTQKHIWLLVFLDTCGFIIIYNNDKTKQVLLLHLPVHTRISVVPFYERNNNADAKTPNLSLLAVS